MWQNAGIKTTALGKSDKVLVNLSDSRFQAISTLKLFALQKRQIIQVAPQVIADLLPADPATHYDYPYDRASIATAEVAQ